LHQLIGLAFWCEEVANLFARRNPSTSCEYR
jgi:hypothetical protein